MTVRLATGLFVGALMRRVQAAGGTAMVLARGDDTAGGLLVVCAERGEPKQLIERGHDIDDRPVWRSIPLDLSHDGTRLGEYLATRRSRDPDLWAIELDIPDSERFAAEMIATN